MFKFIKKNKLKIFCSFTLSFCLSLFGIMAFSTKTYAYTIDTNGNLVGDNIIDINTPYQISNAQIINEDIITTTTRNTRGSFNIWLNNNTTRVSSLALSYNTNYFEFTFTKDNSFNAIEFQFSGNNEDASIIYKFNLTNTLNYTLSGYFEFTDTNNNNIQISYVMLNEGNEALEWEPYGVWYSQSNYNAVIEDNEDLQEQINFRDTSTLLSGIKTTLDNTNLKIYNANNLSLTQMLGTTPFHIETISFPNEDYNYNMEYCNIDTYNAIMNNNGEFSNGDTLTNDPTLLYTFKTPLFVSALTFSRNDTSGTRYIDLYFTDNTSTELLLSEGSENNRLDITWVNADNKYIQYISTTAEIGFNCVYAFTIPNSNQIYTSGYSNGYTDGMYEQYQNDASAIQNANQAKQAMYSQGYSKGIEDASKSHDLGWSSLFFAMADTPFKVVSNVLGFELFGLNLFTTFIGMITVFGVVYLLKKFL